MRLGSRLLGAEKEVCAEDMKSHPFFSCSPLSDEERIRYEEVQQQGGRSRQGRMGTMSDVMKRLRRKAVSEE